MNLLKLWTKVCGNFSGKGLYLPCDSPKDKRGSSLLFLSNELITIKCYMHCRNRLQVSPTSHLFCYVDST